MSLAVKQQKVLLTNQGKTQIPEREWAQDCPLQNITNHILCLETVAYKGSVLECDELKTGCNKSLNTKWERFMYELTCTGNQGNQQITVEMQRVAYFIILLAALGSRGT